MLVHIMHIFIVMNMLIYQNTTVHQCTSEHLDAYVYLDKLIHIHINIYPLVHKIGGKKEYIRVQNLTQF